MTLVVAYCQSGEISIVSDTAQSEKVPPGYFNRYSPLAATLKIIRLSSEICICFSGVVIYAIEAVRKVKEQIQILNLEEILDLLLQEHLKYAIEMRPEFIVASLQQPPTLYKVSGGHIERGLTTCWIGSVSAFSAYQKLFHQHKSSLPSSEYEHIRSSMSSAMQTLIDDDLDETVGGFQVAVKSSSKGFQYIEYFFSYVKQSITGTNQWLPLEILGNAVDGSYSCTLLAPLENNIGAIAIYIYQIKSGIFVHPLVLDLPLVVKGGNPQEFVKHIKDFYDVSLELFISFL